MIFSFLTHNLGLSVIDVLLLVHVLVCVIYDGQGASHLDILGRSWVSSIASFIQYLRQVPVARLLYCFRFAGLFWDGVAL